jgi:hypothetical protein
MKTNLVTLFKVDRFKRTINDEIANFVHVTYALLLKEFGKIKFLGL